jgi:signal peptidase I
MLRALTLASIIGLVFAIVLRAFFIETFIIPSGSMEPSLLPGDHIFVSRLRGQSPSRGEVVVFRRFSELESTGDRQVPFIKRVVGVPGDIVEVRDGATLINGKSLDSESNLPVEAFSNFGPLKLPTGEFFLLGDNRGNSRDSRFFGPVKEDVIIGRAEFIFWSRDRTLGFPRGIRWQRFGLMIQ